ncbi:MAG: hypothetical protein NHF90_00300 [Candidatus Shikimatogenerans sp. JK-2022]|nr:hypothetical protein [Candidatus Shikimatogenerans bostrichidophilus]
MSNKSILKRQRQNKKKHQYNKYIYRLIKKIKKKINKSIFIDKLDYIIINKEISLLFSKLDKFKKKLHLNKISRIKSKFSNLIKKAH